MNEIKIELANIKSEEELHRILADKLSLPCFYGRNWDAFWDSITGLVELPSKIEFLGSEELRRRLPKALSRLNQCFDALNEEFSEIKCEVTWL